MTEKETRLINLLQEGIPLVSRPFEAIAARLDITEDEAIALFTKLKNEGLVRRFGAIVDVSKLGTVSTLVGIEVRDENIPAVTEKINGLKGVTHNYKRDDRYNIWFTLMEADRKTLEKHITTIKEMKEVESLLDLPAVKKYKTKVILTL